MNRLTSTLIISTLALTVASGPAVAHSFGGSGWGMHGGMMNPGQLSDEYLDRLGELMAERYQSMQAIATETDAAERRKLVREHFTNMHQYGKSGGAGKQGKRGMMGQGAGYGHGMMGPGMMGYGGGMMMGPGMMGSGSGMMHGMHYGQLNDEYLDLMGEHMAEQHARMARIAETSDKAERRELLREHFEEMRELMQEMHGQ